MVGGVGQAARFEATLLKTGKAVSNRGPLSKLVQLVSPRNQLCVFDVGKNQHIATGVSKGAFKTLVNAADGRQHLATADKILKAAGISTGGLDAPARVRLARLAATDPSRAADEAALLTHGIEVPQSMRSEVRGDLARVAAGSPQLAKDLAALHDTCTQPGGTVSAESARTIVAVAAKNPGLGGKLHALARAELAGREKPGCTDYMAKRASRDPYMADGRSSPPPGAPGVGALPFAPKFHVTLSPSAFAEVETALGRLQAEGLLKDIALDPQTRTVHVGYSYQAFSDYGRGVDGRYRPGTSTAQETDHNAIKRAFKAAGEAAPENVGADAPEGLKFERAFGTPATGQDRQQTRFDAVKQMFDRYEDFDFGAHDRALPADRLDRLDAALKGKTAPDGIRHILGTEGHRGFVVGEEHSSGAAKRFIHDNLSTLQAMGVNVVAIEHFKQAEIGSMLDAYMSTPPGTPMPTDLATIINGLDKARGMKGPDSLKSLLTEIHDHHPGMRVVCADTENMNPSEDPQHKYEVRMGGMNMVAENNLQAALKPGDKFVLLAGAAHNNTHVGLKNGMPGFSQTLGVPAIGVEPHGADFALSLDREDLSKRTAATPDRPK